MSRAPTGGEAVPKLCGADVELGNFVAGVERVGGSGPEASRALLRAFAAVAPGVSDRAESGRVDPQDWGRHYLSSNGGCAYIDLDHLELCVPEVLSAHDHVAAWHAMLRLAQAALAAANADRPAAHPLQALVNNSDGRGNSYGGHLSLLLTRTAWDDLIERKLHHLAYLAAFQASSLVYTGQGKVGSENGAPPARYQLSQRADFIELLAGPQTTCRRPLVNTRDEPLCGSAWLDGEAPAKTRARLHVISFDSTLCHVASLLRVGVTQIVLAMLEAGWVNLGLALDDPLEALHAWSADPLLQTRARLVDGRELTCVELQLLFLEEAGRFAAHGGLDGIVPRAAEILDLWADTLDRLRRADWAGLSRRLDWVLKLAGLERALRQRPELDWSSPELRYLDQLYGSLDPAAGLFWAWTRAGLVDPVVPEERIANFCSEPPEDTRAWGRAMLLRIAPDAVDRVDWDFIRFRLDARGRRASYRRLALADPLGATRAGLTPLLARSESFEELLANLGAEPVPGPTICIRTANVRQPWWSELVRGGEAPELPTHRPTDAGVD